MVPLPQSVCKHLKIDPCTEFDVLFRMPPMRLVRIFHRLGKKKTDYVSISAKDNGGVDIVSFIKDVLPPGEDEGSTSDDERRMRWLMSDRISADQNEAEDEDEVEEEDAYKYQVSCSDHAYDVKGNHHKATRMYIGLEFKTLLCMTCLHNYIIMTTVLFKDATQVVMCLGQQRNVIMYKNREEKFNGFLVPSANHKNHTRSFREFVRGQCIREFERWEYQMVAANGGGKENQVNEEVVVENEGGNTNDAEADGQEDEH